MLLKPLLMTALETALNSYLALGDNTTAVLAPLAGKIIAITVQPFEVTVYVCPSEHEIQVLDFITRAPDTTISGSASALGLMGVSATPMRAIFAGKVSIEGDTQVAHHFQRLFAKLDIDLETQLAKFTGDYVAGQLGQFFRASKQWQEDFVQSLKLNTSEFLQEETRDLPAPAEAEMAFHEIDVLRNDYDRLQARLHRLEQLLQNHSPA